MFRAWLNENRRSRRSFFGCGLLLSAAFVCSAATLASAQTKRLVLIKCDGLPQDLVDRLVKERDPETGKSELPWIEHIFYQRGTRLSNFYVRGMSLSAPSWSLLETGQHLEIKGNVEFDRYTLHSYDYLNFIPLYLARINGSRIDMPGVEVMDSLGIPLLPDGKIPNDHDRRLADDAVHRDGRGVNVAGAGDRYLGRRNARRGRNLIGDRVGLFVPLPVRDRISLKVLGGRRHGTDAPTEKTAPAMTAAILI